jgi:hypothetical protein
MEGRQTLEHLGLDRGYARQVDHGQGPDPGGGQRIADDVRMRRLLEQIQNLGVAPEQTAQRLGGERIDRLPQRVQTIVGRRVTILQ